MILHIIYTIYINNFTLINNLFSTSSSRHHSFMAWVFQVETVKHLSRYLSEALYGIIVRSDLKFLPYTPTKVGKPSLYSCYVYQSYLLLLCRCNLWKIKYYSSLNHQLQWYSLFTIVKLVFIVPASWKHLCEILLFQHVFERKKMQHTVCIRNYYDYFDLRTIRLSKEIDNIFWILVG